MSGYTEINGLHYSWSDTYTDTYGDLSVKLYVSGDLADFNEVWHIADYLKTRTVYTHSTNDDRFSAAYPDVEVYALTNLLASAHARTENKS